ncbi:MAG: FAD-dependent oxidoreductase [Chitinophagales bacterium]|nr:FAD-dependent oxidoreductase [Chitinophagales bacterium]
MKQLLRRKIRAKLHHYRECIYQPDINSPERLSEERKVAVIGGGLAGISAASNLAARGFKVTLFEKDRFLGGKVGAWTFESQGETLNVEHGFHAFFRQYYNLRDFMKRIGAFDNLVPIDDYLILLADGSQMGFAGLEATPGLNVLDLKKRDVYGWGTLVNPLSMPFLHLLTYDRERTFKKFDKEDFESFAKRTMMPKRMRLVFNSFARAFFSEPEKMSMAELIKGFHFYFLSNEDGLLYDVLNDDFQASFIAYCERYMLQHGVDIRMQSPVQELALENGKWLVNGGEYDYAVLCTDVKHIKPLVEQSASLKAYPKFYEQVSHLQPSDRYAVWRIWTDRFEAKKDLPFFIFTDRFKALDSVTLYHKMEKTSRAWSERHHGGIFELHSYALPDTLRTDADIQAALLDEFYHYFPELKNIQIKHSFFQHRHDFPAFHTGLYANRPEVRTEVPGLYLAGDWVKMDNPTMLMEAAYTSGALAANYIMSKEGVREQSLDSVPLKGLFA